MQPVESTATLDSFAHCKARVAIKDEWDSLEQGPHMTEIRHEFVRRALKEVSAQVVLDYGCGTGLILRKPMPSNVKAYYGMDFMPERADLFTQRLMNSRLEGCFYRAAAARQYITLIETYAKMLNVDTIVLCGVMGYEGFTDLQATLDGLAELSQRVILTLPTITEKYKEDLIVRFDPDVVRATYGGEFLHDGLWGVVV